MKEVKKISVEVLCDMACHEGKYYPKGKTISEFPYDETVHSENYKPVKVEAPVEQPKAEEVKTDVVEKVEAPVRKGRK
jgi:hypothetical protein